MVHGEFESGVFGHGTLGTGPTGSFTFGWAYTEIEDTLTSTVTISEAPLCTLEQTITEPISFSESIAQVYEMAYAEIVDLIETVAAGYDWRSACVHVDCELSTPPTVTIYCKLTCS